MNNWNKRGGIHHMVTAQTHHSANTDILHFALKAFVIVWQKVSLIKAILTDTGASGCPLC